MGGSHLFILMFLFNSSPLSVCLRSHPFQRALATAVPNFATAISWTRLSSSTKEGSIEYQETCKAILKPGKSRLFKSGNPIVFGGALDRVEGKLAAGQEVYLFDHKNNVIGRGFYNPHSQYRVRMLCHQHEKNLFGLSLDALISARIKYAKELREQLNLPSSSNSVYRLINGEGINFLPRA